MTDLERKALMGNKEAQQECTEKGIVLPCPFCGNENIRISNWGMWRCWCQECFGKSEDCIRERDAIRHWNTRPAPPIGRCGECKEYDTDNCSEGCGWCQVWDIGRFDDGFCDKFKPKGVKNNAVD